MPKKILIVSHTFPPSPLVGGRRWSKMVPHLVNRGNEVHVITATPDTNGQYNTLVSGNLTIHRIKSGYPEILSHYDKKNFFQKIAYNFWVKYLSFSSKGNIYDKSCCWKKTLQAEIIKLTTVENIDNIIVSAPPFQQLYYVTELKTNFPHLNIILDLRDAWAEHSAFGEWCGLNKERMSYQLALERMAFEKADYIVAVSQGITDAFKQYLNKSPEKFITITNGFNRSDYAFLNTSLSNQRKGISILYYGSVYPLIEETLETLVIFINKNADKLIEANVRFEFCGHISEDSLSILRKANPQIFFYHGVKPTKEALTILNRATAGLIIIAKDHEDIQFNTKLLECMALSKPIFLLGPEGTVSHFLTENKIGVQFTNDKLDMMMEWILNKDKFNSLTYKYIDTSPFEFINLVKKVETLLK